MTDSADVENLTVGSELNVGFTQRRHRKSLAVSRREFDFVAV